MIYSDVYIMCNFVIVDYILICIKLLSAVKEKANDSQPRWRAKFWIKTNDLSSGRTHNKNKYVTFLKMCVHAQEKRVLSVGFPFLKQLLIPLNTSLRPFIYYIRADYFTTAKGFTSPESSPPCRAASFTFFLPGSPLESVIF